MQRAEGQRLGAAGGGGVGQELLLSRLYQAARKAALDLTLPGRKQGWAAAARKYSVVLVWVGWVCGPDPVPGWRPAPVHSNARAGLSVAWGSHASLTIAARYSAPGGSGAGPRRGATQGIPHFHDGLWRLHVLSQSSYTTTGGSHRHLLSGMVFSNTAVHWVPSWRFCVFINSYISTLRVHQGQMMF